MVTEQVNRRDGASAANGSRQRLYRDMRRGKLLGVCAGIADYFGFGVTVTRIAAAFMLLFFPPFTIASYLILGVLLPVKPPEFYGDEDKDRFWRDIRRSPQNTLSEVRHRFRALELRLRHMETYVTSERYDLDRQFRDLGEG